TRVRYGFLSVQLNYTIRRYFSLQKNYNTKGSAPDQMIRGRALFVGMNFVTSPFFNMKSDAAI
ncbi:hypothetical protein, partial [uncultured Dialister sp.]|uniref:hypothetical protein n=1 Tax=uncultured Dialister sp. TaxID=278064 RepID=UPI0026734F05